MFVGVSRPGLPLATPLVMTSSSPIQVSGSCTSSTLSERSLYSNFFRTVQPDIRENPGHVALMNHFRWRKVAIIHQENPNFEMVI